MVPSVQISIHQVMDNVNSRNLLIYITHASINNWVILGSHLTWMRENWIIFNLITEETIVIKLDDEFIQIYF